MKFSIRNKILTGYFLVLVLVLIVWAWGTFLIKDVGESAQLILRENYRSIEAASKMINSISRQNNIQLQNLFQYADDSELLFRNNEMEFLRWLGRAKDNITIRGEDEIISNLEEGYSEYLGISANFFAKIRNADPEAGNFYENILRKKIRAIMDECTKLADLNQNTMYSASQTTQDIAVKSFYGIMAIGIIAVATGILFSIFLSSRLSSPIQDLAGVTKKIGDGNLDVDIKVNSSDEIGLLAKELGDMLRKLKNYRELNIGNIIAERRRAEAIIQSVGDAILVFDKEFKIALVNQAAEKILNFTSQEAVGKHFLEVLKDEDLFNYLKGVIEKRETIPLKEIDDNILTIEKKKKKFHYYFSLNPVETEQKKIIGAVLLLKDISKLKDLEKMKSDFIAAASHELKNPLSSISMSINLLLEKERDEKNKELLFAARDDCQRLESIIADLLDLSKLESGEVKMEYEDVDLTHICRKAINVFEKQAEEKNVKLEFLKEKEMPLSVRLDGTKITWVLTNLIGNALRYTDKGGYIRIKVKTAKDKVSVSVEDNGAGIPYEYQSKIFDKLVCLTGREETGGSGLGLSIAKEIVRAHGGNIWVDSKPGKGSIFTFTLPLT